MLTGLCWVTLPIHYTNKAILRKSYLKTHTAVANIAIKKIYQRDFRYISIFLADRTATI